MSVHLLAEAHFLLEHSLPPMIPAWTRWDLEGVTHWLAISQSITPSSSSLKRTGT